MTSLPIKNFFSDDKQVIFLHGLSCHGLRRRGSRGYIQEPQSVRAISAKIARAIVVEIPFSLFQDLPRAPWASGMSIMTVCMTQVLGEARSASVSLGIPVALVTVGKVAARSKGKKADACMMCNKTRHSAFHTR